MSEKTVSKHFTKEMADEYMWGGYLKFCVEQGIVTDDTPEEAIWDLKNAFLEDLNGEA